MYLFPHDISGLHDTAGGQSVVTGQQDGLLQCHTEGAAAEKERGKKPLRSGSLCTLFKFKQRMLLNHLLWKIK